MKAVRHNIVRRNIGDFDLRVEMLYRLFFMVDMGQYRPWDKISGGCAKFRSVAFKKNSRWPPSLTNILNMGITRSIFELET